MCSRPSTVALIEDDESYRSGVEQLLQESGRFTVSAAYSTANAALAELPRNPPAIALVDINLPDRSGSDAVRLMRQLCPSVRCVMLTSFEDSETLFNALRSGASGYLLKGSGTDEILGGLDELLAGGAPMSPSIARRVLASFARPAPRLERASVTVREREVLDLLAEGCSYKEIAEALKISPGTVKNHLAHIYEKLAVRSATQAALKWRGQ